MSFLLDTHIWFWYLTGSGRLPAGLRRRIEREPENCWLSPVSVWELGMLERRGRVRLTGGLRNWVEEALTALPLRDTGLSREVAIRSQEISVDGDPADLLLSATALVHELRLMTVDKTLALADWLPTISR